MKVKNNLGSAAAAARHGARVPAVSPARLVSDKKGTHLPSSSATVMDYVYTATLQRGLSGIRFSNRPIDLTRYRAYVDIIIIMIHTVDRATFPNDARFLSDSGD